MILIFVLKKSFAIYDGVKVFQVTPHRKLIMTEGWLC